MDPASGMDRRELLATICTSTIGFAGCSSDVTEPETRPTDSPDGTPAASMPLSEYECPPSDSYAGAAICSQTVDPESASVYLLPSEAAMDASIGTVELTLYNQSSTELTFNPYQWSIMREVSSGWEPLEKRVAGDGRLTLPPGQTQTWTLGDVVDFVNEQATIDAGTYTAGINVPNPDSSEWIRCIALFRLN